MNGIPFSDDAVTPVNPPAFLLAAIDSACLRDLFGIVLLAWDTGTVTLGLDHRPEMGHMPGWFQGAVTSAIAEYAAALSGMTIAPDLPAATIQQNIHFTGPARGTRLIATGRILSSGRTISTTGAQVEVERDGALHPCASLTMTLAHQTPRPPQS
jgi:acyl-coenzyme A thioesterase PaaI-like protein